MIKLRPADPFDLIRWLARSQMDPRKAVAELVQNALDANARHVTVHRRRIGGAPALIVTDDGDGVLPDLDREEALRYLARHIGHSRKAQLTPSERRERVIAGKYGVGLLGFWAIGHRFELRSRVAGSPIFALCLVEDQDGGRIEELAHRMEPASTFTEAVVLELHDTALRSLSGARLASYLGSELRGQLLAREVTLVIHDGMARGLAQKRFEVRPHKFLGERLELPTEIDVPGYAPILVELHLARGDTSASVQIACAGTVVAENVRELSGLELEEAPWIGRELVGVLDFADFTVPPGTRRGVLPNAAAEAFVRAIEKLRGLVDKELERFERLRDRDAQRDLAKELRRALRGFAQRLPQYELPGVSRDGERGADGAGEESADASPPGVGVGDAEVEAPIDETESYALFAPELLASARIVPSTITLRPGRERRVRGDGLDDQGRIIRHGLVFEWSVDAGEDVTLIGGGQRPALVAREGACVGSVAGTLRMSVREEDREETATASIVIDDAEVESAFAQGIPEPVFESDPRGTWRSRFDGARFVVNDAHEDWIALRTDPRTRLRYALSLFAKELVLRSFGELGAPEALDRLVEILAHAERNLGASR